MGKFHPIDRDLDCLLPPSVQDWLPADHLARYVVEVVESLDWSDRERAYAGPGRAAYPPGTAAVAVGLRRRHGRLLPSQDRAGDRRVAGVPRPGRQPPSRP